MKKILITGAGGFVGKYITEFLENKGYNVVGLIRNRKENYSFPVMVHDLSQPIKSDEIFDVIVHAAGSLPYNQKDFREFKKNNIDVMENLISFSKRNSLTKIINLSTIGVYGDFREVEIKETSDIINPDFYGITKYVAELLLQAETNIDNISLRMPGIIGEGSRGVWLPNTVQKFMENQDVKIYSPAFVTKNFVYINDLAKFICVLVEKKIFEKKIVALACSKGATVRDIVTKIKELTKSESKIIIDNNMRTSFCIDNTTALEMGYESLSVMEILVEYCKSVVRK